MIILNWYRSCDDGDFFFINVGLLWRIPWVLFTLTVPWVWVCTWGLWVSRSSFLSEEIRIIFHHRSSTSFISAPAFFFNSFILSLAPVLKPLCSIVVVAVSFFFSNLNHTETTQVKTNYVLDVTHIKKVLVWGFPCWVCMFPIWVSPTTKNVIARFDSVGRSLDCSRRHCIVALYYLSLA